MSNNNDPWSHVPQEGGELSFRTSSGRMFRRRNSAPPSGGELTTSSSDNNQQQQHPAVSMHHYQPMEVDLVYKSLADDGVGSNTSRSPYLPSLDQVERLERAASGSLTTPAPFLAPPEEEEQDNNNNTVPPFAWSNQDINWQGIPSGEAVSGLVVGRKSSREIVQTCMNETRRMRNFALDDLDLSGKTVCWGGQEQAAKLAQQASLMPLNLDIEAQRRMAAGVKRSARVVNQLDTKTPATPFHHQHPPRPPPPAQPLCEESSEQQAMQSGQGPRPDHRAQPRNHNDTPQTATNHDSRSDRDSNSLLEHIPQPDMVQDHALMLNVSKGMLRQMNRPKLPLNKAVRTTLPWHFQISPPSPKYHAGAFGDLPAKLSTTMSNISTPSDLTPLKGKLVVLEYSEERPIYQVSRGMCTKVSWDEFLPVQ